MKNDDQEHQEEISELYTLFMMHAKGESIVEHFCPNCGDMPHLKIKLPDRVTLTCLQCKCVSGSS
jgi:predicted  nucleic acid-binding Zn ribbon protein